MSSTRKSQSDRSAETSGKILRAAQKLFALRGFNGVTMRAVASEAGVNLASIVYYFENTVVDVEETGKCHRNHNPEYGPERRTLQGNGLVITVHKQVNKDGTD